MLLQSANAATKVRYRQGSPYQREHNDRVDLFSKQACTKKRSCHKPVIQQLLYPSVSHEQANIMAVETEKTRFEQIKRFVKSGDY